MEGLMKPVKTKPKPVKTIAVSMAAGLALTAVVLLVVSGSRSSFQRAAPQTTASGVVGVAVGDVAPDFRLTDAYSRQVSRTSLIAGKPGLMFFTTTYCLPCIRGLQDLVRFERDVGSDRMNVVIVFVDPRENNEDLRWYRKQYGFPPTWYYALATDDMVVKYRIRALDTKFVLDRQGVIRFADVYPATYETWRRALAPVGITPPNR